MVTIKPHIRQNVLIVDPIFRGSRLFFSKIVASGAISRGYASHILTRTEAKTENYYELFSNIEHRLYEQIELPTAFWYGKMDRSAVKKTIECIKAYNRTLQFNFIYFAGLNEYYPQLLEMLMDESDGLNHKKIIMVDYDASYLILPNNLPADSIYRSISPFFCSILRSVFKKTYIDKSGLMKKLLSKYPYLKIALLDERAFRKESVLIKKKELDRYIWLPDPGPVVRINVKPILEEKIRVLLIGIQSKRKGLEDVIKLMEINPQVGKSVHFILSGSFPEETGHLKSRINAMSGIFDFREGYFSEEIIQNTYQQCDYVMLPYEKSFQGSSGVMGYAAAFGKPMITTAHGCIGFRVKEFDLGFSYESGDIVKLNKIMNSLPIRNTEEYQKMSRNCYQYDSDRSICEHQRLLFDAIGEMN